MERKLVSMNVNPCKMCMPMGASLAFKGLEKSMTLIHGSQGCSTYIRRHIATHFNEPVDIASSSLSEQGTVYGGASNLVLGLENVVKVYQPSVVGVLTTCLAETIGEDIDLIIKSSDIEEKYPEVDFISVKTPGYEANEYKGYLCAVKAIVQYYAKEKTEKSNRLNVIVSDVSCADIRAIKRMLQDFDIDYILVPDISDTLDAPFGDAYTKGLLGGTKKEDIMDMANSKATLEIGALTDNSLSAGDYLETTFGVKNYRCPLPIGLEGMDQFLAILKEVSGKDIPQEYQKARGRMLDAMVDSHKFNREIKACIFGTPELVYAVTTLCVENGIEPAIVAVGSEQKKLKYKLEPLLNQHNYNPVMMDDTDMLTIREQVVKQKATLIIGSTEGKYIREKEGIPHIKIGFPIHDHLGAQRILNVGYDGSLRLLDSITNTYLDEKHHRYRKDTYDQYYISEETLTKNS